MQNEFYEAWNTMTQQTLENLKKIGEANLKVTEKLLREQVQLTTALVDAVSNSAQEAAGTKDVKELAALQAEVAQECGKKVLETSRSCADILAEAGKTYNQVFEAGVKAASNNVPGTPANKDAKKAA